MAIYEQCSDCRGLGYSRCTSCLCETCKGSGKGVQKCSDCEGGSVLCSTCDSTGRVLVKEGWFWDTYDDCSSCDGKGRHPCPVCGGSKWAKGNCLACDGRGRQSQCTHCGGTQKIKCAHCGGEGRLEGAWFQTLRNMPIDTLRFEHEKRRSKILSLRLEINQEQTRAEEVEAMVYDRLTKPEDMLDSGPAWSYISQLKEKIDDIQTEMKAIETVLSERYG